MTGNNAYEAVIGLEVHAQLNTKSKIFCGCATTFEEKENINICEICTGMPGSLPVLNRRAVDYALRMSVATHCQVRHVSVFARKNYFYPDLPKGYQISQYEQPLAERGYVEIDVAGRKKKIGLVRIHIEEDAGKNVHRASGSFVNLNRAGIPLIEIVSEPDIRTPEEASAYLKELRKILRYLEISEANMEEGNLRCDVNVSLRPRGTDTLGTRAEVKNINSFRFVEKAIAFEISRQQALLDEGKSVMQETRLWDSQQNQTFSMRSKEAAHDYRYFPDPDLLPLTVDQAWLEAIEKNLPELAAEKQARFVKEFGLPDYDASLLTQEKGLADYFETAVKQCKNPKLVGNWILSELLREFDTSDIDRCLVKAEDLGELVHLIETNVVSGKIAKDVFEKMLKTGMSPTSIVEKEGLVQISDETSVGPIIEEVLQENAEAVEKYRGGNHKLLGFFVGQVMKKTDGKANPGLVNQILKKALSKK